MKLERDDEERRGDAWREAREAVKRIRDKCKVCARACVCVWGMCMKDKIRRKVKTWNRRWKLKESRWYIKEEEKRNTWSAVIVFSTVSCLSLINSCCRSVLAQTPPAHNHKCNPSQPCQGLYYSCGPNTRPENGMSTLQAGLADMPALTVKATGNHCWNKCPTVSALSKKHCSLCHSATAG